MKTVVLERPSVSVKRARAHAHVSAQTVSKKKGASWCPLGLSHKPNAETIAALEEAEAGGGVRYSSFEELLADLHNDED